jgi:adenine-specific DNA-methyltransferase
MAVLIKYLGSKRLLVDTIVDVVAATGANSVADVFTGTTRVAQGLKRAGMHLHANDSSAYAHTLARTYIEADADAVDLRRLQELIDQLNALPGIDGYVTETFCRQARYFQPENGMRIDAIRAAIDDVTTDEIERSILLTSLMLAADRVDSTAGVQMAYLKAWAQRSHKQLHLEIPALLPGNGTASCCDANDLARTMEHVDLAYIDPPYNQHSYRSNYHVWETLVLGDEPEAYGVARKRIDCRTVKSAYNSKRNAAAALADLVEHVPASWLLVSFSNEGFHDRGDLERMLQQRDETVVFAIDHPRYVGARIGIHNPQGERVGEVSHTRNTEFLFLTGPDASNVADSVSSADVPHVRETPSAPAQS